jgi:integrase
MASKPFYVRARNAWYIKYRPDPRRGWVKEKLCRNETNPPAGVTPRVPKEATEKAREFERIEFMARHGLKVEADPPSRAALEEFLDAYAASHALSATPGTVSHLARGIKRFKEFALARGVASLGDVTGAMCREFLDGRLRYVMPSTLRTERGYLMGPWTRAVEDGLIASNPWDSARVKGKAGPWSYTYWPPEEIDRIAAECTETWQSDLVLFMANTGLRIQTALASRRSWVDVRARSLRIEPGPRVKTAYAMTLNGVALGLVERRRSGVPSSPLIFGREGSERPYSYTTARDAIDRAIGRAKVPRGTPHDIRHSYGRTLALAGVPVTIIQRQLGHASLKMTMRYISAEDGQAARFIEGVDLGGRGVTDDSPRT